MWTLKNYVDSSIISVSGQVSVTQAVTSSVPFVDPVFQSVQQNAKKLSGKALIVAVFITFSSLLYSLLL